MLHGEYLLFYTFVIMAIRKNMVRLIRQFRHASIKKGDIGLGERFSSHVFFYVIEVFIRVEIPQHLNIRLRELGVKMITGCVIFNGSI